MRDDSDVDLLYVLKSGALLGFAIDALEVSISARRQRAVLACLALHPGEAVSADRLLEDVWGDDLPDTRARAVAFQISKLRDILEPERVGEGTVITTSPAGYVLHVERDCVDVHRFDRLLDEARALPTRGRCLASIGSHQR